MSLGDCVKEAADGIVPVQEEGWCLTPHGDRILAVSDGKVVLADDVRLDMVKRILFVALEGPGGRLVFHVALKDGKEMERLFPVVMRAFYVREGMQM